MVRSMRHRPVRTAVALILLVALGSAVALSSRGTTAPSRARAHARTSNKSDDGLRSADAAAVSKATRTERTATSIAGVRIERNVTFTTSADPAQLQLDIYHPTAAGATALPVVLVVHGGAWRTGAKEDVAVEALRLARNGFVAVAPNYRLACGSSHDQNPACGWHHPAPVNDIGEAVRWVDHSIALYGGDPARVGLLGFSAGGQLAEMVAFGADATAPRVAAVVAWSAPLPRLLGTSRRRLTDFHYVGCSFRRCPQKWLAASPDTYASPDDPPTRIVESAKEIVPALHGRELARVLRAASVPVEFRLYPGARHATQFELTEWTATLRFLHAHLAHAVPTNVTQVARSRPNVFVTPGD